MLATWGLSLLMVGAVTLIFGSSAVSVPAPIPCMLYMQNGAS